MGKLARRGPRSLATASLVLLLLVGMSSTASAATIIGDWKLKGSFKNAAGTAVKLEAVGSPEFQTTNVSGSLRKALVFGATEGAKLTRVPKTARSSYSILIYFEIDAVTSYRRIFSWGTSVDDPALYTFNGELHLYPHVETPTALVEGNQWNRLLITREGSTGLVRMYLNGRLRLAWVDYEQEFRLTGGTAHFFIDNAGDDASGTIANIRLWRGVVSP